jgi:hypothetical protein
MKTLYIIHTYTMYTMFRINILYVSIYRVINRKYFFYIISRRNKTTVKDFLKFFVRKHTYLISYSEAKYFSVYFDV